jgi:phosphatidylglycerophosphate synthase
MMAIIVLLAVDAQRDGSEVLALGVLLLYVAAALTLWSMWQYLRRRHARGGVMRLNQTQIAALDGFSAA